MKVLFVADPKVLEEEVKILKIINEYPHCDPNIVCYYDAFATDLIYPGGRVKRVFCILTEFVEGQDLMVYSVKNDITHDVVLLEDITYWLLTTIDNLHKRGYAHRDIKPENIIIQPNGHLKLIDFGLSCMFGGKKKSKRNHPSPEAPLPSSYDEIYKRPTLK